jgi:hypothetical protein
MPMQINFKKRFRQKKIQKEGMKVGSPKDVDTQFCDCLNII